MLPRNTINAVNRYLNNERIYGNIHWHEWEQKIEDVRNKLAKLINATSSEIAFVQNTSMGLSIVANGIQWRKGENIVLNDMEFPANLYPWQVQAKKHNLEIRAAKNKDGQIPIEEYEKLIDDNTKVVTVSWVEFQNGFTHDLKQLADIAHEHNAYLVVDGIQGVGMLTLDVKKDHVDFLACGGHKWLISPIGIGFLYVKEELLDDLEVSFVGWRSHKNPDDFSYSWFEPAETAKRFDGGSPNVLGAIGLGKSIEYILQLGAKNIEQHDLSLANYIIERLQELENVSVISPLDDNNKPMSAIVSFTTNKVDTVHKALIDNKIIVSLRLNAIRVSPHLYNTKSDIDNLIETLKTEIQRRE